MARLPSAHNSKSRNFRPNLEQFEERLAPAAGLFVTPKFGLIINEGNSQPVNVALKSQPAHDVRVAIVSQNVADVKVSPRVLTFTPANWNVAQSFAIIALNTVVGEPKLEPARVNLTASGDAKYVGVQSAVSLTVRDLGKAAFNGIYSGNLTATGNIPSLGQAGTIDKSLQIQFSNGKLFVLQPTGGEVKPIVGSTIFTLNANGTASLSFKATASQSGLTATFQVNALGRRLADGTIVFQGHVKSLSPAVITITSSSFIVTRAPV